MLQLRDSEKALRRSLIWLSIKACVFSISAMSSCLLLPNVLDSNANFFPWNIPELEVMQEKKKQRSQLVNVQ